MGFAGAAPLTVRGEGARAGRVFHVSDPSKPASGASRFDRVRYVSVAGTDIVFHGRTNGRCVFDFELAPGADPGRIRLDFTGADDLAIEKNGDLAVTVAGQRAHVRKPWCSRRLPQADDRSRAASWPTARAPCALHWPATTDASARHRSDD